MKRSNTLVSTSLVFLFGCLLTWSLAPHAALSQATPAPTAGPTVAPTTTGPTPTPGGPMPTPVGPPPTPRPTAAPTGVNYTYTVSSGQTSPIVTGDDATSFSITYNQTQSITLPFSYNLYDQTFYQATISPQGNLQFIGSNINNSNSNQACLPLRNYSYTIFPFYDPTFPYNVLVTTSTSGQEPNLIYNMEFQTYQYGFAPTPDNIYSDYEVRLYEGRSRFDIVYANTQTGFFSGYFGTVGVQKDQSTYTSYECYNGGQNTVSANETLTFTLPDTIAPTIFLGVPASGATLTDITEISGQADDTGGSGLSSVGVTIRRDSDGLYFNGTTFVANAVSLPATFSGDNFTIASLPGVGTLKSGSYTITATATDGAGNTSSASASVTIGVPDTTAPTVAITSPADFAKLTSFPAITGTASDDTGGSGLDHVDLIIQRLTDGYYWTGTAWSPSPTLLTTNLNGNTWSRTFQLPTGTNLVDSAYQIFAYATDKAGNSSGQAVLINIDRTAPSSIVFTTPANNTTVNQFNIIQGTALDAPNGTGISQVNVFLRRGSDGAYFNGTTWVAAPTALTALLSRNPTLPDGTAIFTVRSLPTGANLTDGRYILTAVATDKVGNASSQFSSFTYSKIDHTAPTVAFTNPKANATVTSLAPITGTIADNPTGSGPARVTLTLQRSSDGKYWNGSTWVSTLTQLTTVLITSTTPATWSRTAQLPSGTNLLSGKYNLAATGYDKAGNHATVTEVVNARGTTTTKSISAASGVALSTATATTATGSVQLRFVGALDAESASDAASYTAYVNGHAVAVQSAAYNTVTHGVTLDLGPGALRLGDSVAISWSVLDAQGRAVAGQSGAVVAR